MEDKDKNYYQDTNTGFITQTDQDQNTYQSEIHRIGLQQNNKQIYHIDLAEPPIIQDYEMFSEMPKQVEFKNLVSNILNARDIKKNKDDFQEQERNQKNKNMYSHGQKIKVEEEAQPKTKYDRWKQYLTFEENKAVISDCFWFAICKYKIQKAIFLKNREDTHLKITTEESFQEDKYDETIEKLLNRIAKNYVNLLLSIPNQTHSEVFFKTYFDIVAQAVLYAFFYAFPKSRREFNNNLKRDLITWFSKEFTGIPIANSEKYWSKWNLYLLGEGNILEKKKPQFVDEQQFGTQSNHQSSSSLPEISLKNISKQRNKRQIIDVRFSPIIDRYINRYKYKTRNTIQRFKMKFTEYDKDQEKIEKHFKDYQNLAEQIKDKSSALYEDNVQRKNKMNEEIRKWKKETVKHHRRLEKRKAEELERGCHEYANYLVSMLNAGLSNANLGVTNQKGLF